MTAMMIRQQKAALRREIASWQAGALGLLVLAAAVNTALIARIGALESRQQEEAARYQAQIEQAEHIRDLAVQELGAMSLQQAREQEARAEQAAAYEMIGAYRYVGECTITYYCPCEECCGEWADGLTATGLPTGPGIVAVDKNVIPLGSTVIIDGQKYLAADTGVKGQAVDICMAGHQEAVDFGVQRREVWVRNDG